MFGLQKYLTQIYDIKWYFNIKDKDDLEDLMYVDFETCDGYFLIKKIRYTYIDILLALEDMKFELKKNDDGIKIKILKI